MSDEIRFTVNEQGAAPSSGKRSPAASWGEVALAALPFVLILLIDGLPKLLVLGGWLTWEDAGMRLLNVSLTVLAIACLLAVFILAWRRRWQAWSATWYLFFCIPPLLLAVGLYSLLTQGQLNFTISQESVMYVWMPLFIAVLLYAVTRLDPLRGLLAALPVIYLLWQPNMEFVPDEIELAIKIPSIALVCMAITFVLRRDDWREGLFAVLAMNLAVGALFAYAGIYYGGTLPFVAPGPNLVEVARSLIPQYLAISAILLGPLFAWKFRQAGLASGRGGKIAYHLVLAGLLLVIMANLAGLMRTLQVDSPGTTASNVMSPVIILGLGIYLAGVIWLYRHTSFSRTASGMAEGILLPLLPLGIPVMLMLPFITWKWPVSNLYGIPLLWVLPHAVSLSLGLVWLGLSAWVITRRGQAQTSPNVGAMQPSAPAGAVEG
jgi:hypothetical protein